MIDERVNYCINVLLDKIYPKLFVYQYFDILLAKCKQQIKSLGPPRTFE